MISRKLYIPCFFLYFYNLKQYVSKTDLDMRMFFEVVQQGCFPTSNISFDGNLQCKQEIDDNLDLIVYKWFW